ncbi:cobalamin biosynthesis protein CbiL [Cohaesibacter sp. CAU 1516]|uniref:cobalamin biosynthesis protein CbiL n=1 Tax=Cohaesibacter sp. CAU 1516 TaxID=2576038 RepID=UPI0010FE0F69|nr:cobalamin biosynthesis protein CbiL [Cohaesibacter sp. CAU 1516]TLP46106.1 cobalamin biosynthesis protein CbiL [Cohaesibacter sp. CAU 1516]
MFRPSILPLVRLICLLLMCLGASAPAIAHSLKLFATVEGDVVRGYGFFVGGGRPQNVRWSARMEGKIVAEGMTDDQGAFRFPVPHTVTAPLTVTINSGDGHVSSRALKAERFGAEGIPSHVPQSFPHPAPQEAAASGTGNGLTEAQIRTAVAREITPLLERIEEMDARVRLADIIAGICLIFGLAGLTLWVKAKRSVD